MDIFSNFVKRPISIVMQKSRSTSPDNSHGSTYSLNVMNNTPTRSPSPMPVASSLIATAMNTSINTELTDLLNSAKQNLNISPGSANVREDNAAPSSVKPQSAAMSAPTTPNATDRIRTTEEFPANMSQSVPAAIELLQTPTNQSPSVQSLNSPTSTSLNLLKQSEVVKQMLIEINENIDQAVQADETLQTNDSFRELSPLAAKTIGIKLAPTQTSAQAPAQTQIQSQPQPSITRLQPQTSNSVGVGTSFEINSTLNKFCVDPELEDGIFDELPPPVAPPIEHVGASIETGVNVASNKFIGLTEYDESKIPELPGGLNPNFEAQLNLHMTDVEELLDGVTAAPAPATDNKKLISLIGTVNESDLSDNEMFDAECLSYFSTEETAEQSELETYGSALARDSDEQLIFTLENEDDTNSAGVGQSKAELLASIDQEQQHPVMQLQVHPTNITYVDEPMDVDMNNTLDLLTSKNITHNICKTTTPTEETLSLPLAPTGVAYVEIAKEVPGSTEGALPDNICESASISQMNTTVNLTSAKTECALANTQLEKKECEMTPIAEVDVLSINAQALETSASSTQSELNNKSSTSSQHDMKLNITLDMTASSTISIKSSPPNSPSFPIKPNSDIKKFPRSPTTMNDENKEMPYLEKSDFAELLNTTPSRKTSTNCEPAKICSIAVTSNNAVSRKISTSAEPPKITPTVPVNQHEANLTPIARDQTIEVAYNGHNDNVNNLTCAIEAPEQATWNTDCRRRTFNLAANEALPNTGMTRRTFSIVDSPPLSSEAATLGKASDEQRRIFSIPPPSTTNDKQAALTASCVDEANAEAARRTFSIVDSPPLSSEAAALGKASDAQRRTFSILSPSTGSDKQFASTATCDDEAMDVDETLPLPTDGDAATTFISTSPPLSARRSSASSADILSMPPPKVFSTLLPTARPPLHLPVKPASLPMTLLLGEQLSAKEQSKTNAKDEKDVAAVDTCVQSPLDQTFPSTVATADINKIDTPQPEDDQFFVADFQASNNVIFNPSDFDFLLTKGNNNVPVDRSSLLLKFDPLLGKPVAVNQQLSSQSPLPSSQSQQSSLQLPQSLYSSSVNNQRLLSPTIEEHNESNSSSSFSAEKVQLDKEIITAAALCDSAKPKETEVKPPYVDRSKKHAKMSVDVIDNDCNKFENSNSQSDEKQINYKMDELEKKIKNEALKTDDIEKKLREAEQREEALIKRITEKDKAIAKLNNVIEAYEKAIAELISEKEQISQNYEKQLAEAKADRDSNYHHLTSLETTFSDLHVKYEKSKEMTTQLKESEEMLLNEKKQNLENLRLQEQRYEKMKNHAIQQLEIANRKLETQTKEHSIEVTKLKALLKKEEISRASITEQLQQKSRENSELVKICDELINGQGS